MDGDKYKIKFEIFYGVHHGIPGFPITETEFRELIVGGDSNPYLDVARYLVESQLFPTSSGYLSAKILEISNKEKKIEHKKLIRIDSLELIVAREILESKNERIKHLDSSVSSEF